MYEIYLSRIYLPLIIPIIEYSYQLQDGGSQQESEHNQFEARIVVIGLPVLPCREAIYFETDLKPLVDRRKFRKLKMVHSLHNGPVPVYLCDVMPQVVCQVSSYDLQNSNNYEKSRYKQNINIKSFFSSTTIEWNWRNPDKLTYQDTNLFFKRKMKSNFDTANLIFQQ